MQLVHNGEGLYYCLHTPFSEQAKRTLFNLPTQEETSPFRSEIRKEKKKLEAAMHQAAVHQAAVHQAAMHQAAVHQAAMHQDLLKRTNQNVRPQQACRGKKCTKIYIYIYVSDSRSLSVSVSLSLSASLSVYIYIYIYIYNYICLCLSVSPSLFLSPSLSLPLSLYLSLSLIEMPSVFLLLLNLFFHFASLCFFYLMSIISICTNPSSAFHLLYGKGLDAVDKFSYQYHGRLLSLIVVQDDRDQH